MATTSIEWTRGDDGTAGVVWNPSTGCDKVSPGCDNCYALTMAKRLKGMGQAKYQNDGDPRTSGPGFGLTVHSDALSIPLRWRKPRRVFVNSMSDLFHARVPDEFIAQVWAVMAATPQHTYQVLTKRHARMRSVLCDECQCPSGHAPGVHFRSMMEWAATPGSSAYVPGLTSGLYHRTAWPLPNVWLGVSAENQQWADIRIPALLDTPAAVRWVSAEPLLGPIDLTRVQIVPPVPPYGPGVHLDSLCGHAIEPDDVLPTRISWVVCGGESGPGARPMDLEWARSLVRQCRDAGVPVFVKQLGEAWARDTRHHGSPVATWDRKGVDPMFWPPDLQVREHPTAVAHA